MATDAERIKLIAELATLDAREELGREIAKFNAQMALDKGFGNSRRWLGLADRLALAGRNYVSDLAVKITEVSTANGALESYTKAVESFLSYLDQIYQAAWEKDRPFRRGDSLPPAAWYDAKLLIEKALKLQQSNFACSSDTAASLADTWRVPTASQGSWNISDPDEWMSFGEACDFAQAALGKGANEEVGRSAIISRANDGLLMATASRTELVFEELGNPPETRDFSDWDAARFSEMLQSAFHNLPCPAIQEAETLALRHANWRLGDFKFEIQCENPEYRVTLFAWGMAFRRSDVNQSFGHLATQSTNDSKSEPAMSRANAQGECETWLENAFREAMSGNKETLKSEAQQSIQGLSGKAFYRAWDKVAPRYKRNLAGRLKKSDPRNHSPK